MFSPIFFNHSVRKQEWTVTDLPEQI